MGGMRPRAFSKKGEMLSTGFMTLLVPDEPGEALSFLKFQGQKTADPKATREAVLRYLAGDFYQLPELFSDRLTAVHAADSETAAVLLKHKEVLLDFEQFSQAFRMFAKVKKLAPQDEVHDFSLWHARGFNRNIPNDAVVVTFAPDWRSAVSVRTG
ncbi:MAG: hypothetical protein ACKVP5_18120 [Aestuariivirga sp.]